MMLNSLFINNYRKLQDFKIDSLGRVNLITGKNNTSKTTLLEAIAIYATKGELSFIVDLLTERGEKFRRFSETETRMNTESNMINYSSLFTNRLFGFEKENEITIGSAAYSVRLRFVKFHDDTQKDLDGALVRKRSIIAKGTADQYPTYHVGFESSNGDGAHLLSLEEHTPAGFNFHRKGETNTLQFIRTRNIDREINGKLWDNITLTEKEAYVIDALKIIEPDTERIAFIEDLSRERSAVIKLSNGTAILPLHSMGDGMNRILTIILALVSSDNGYLLIDEFENGLHYSVQEKLWCIIFSLAKKLNVQVFVTTHSDDCISGFQNTLNNPDHELTGKLIRLDNVNGLIKQVEFSANELKIATNQHIEIR